MNAAHLAEAHAAFRARQFAAADVACRDALRSNPADADALCLLGRIQVELGRPGLAVAFLGRAVALRPDDAHLHYRLGIAAQARGDLSTAERCLERARALAPHIARYWYALGTLLLEQRHLARATASLRTALELDPGFASAHVNLGIALLGQASAHEALQHLQDALALDPDQPDVHSNVLLMQQYEASWSRAEALENARGWARRFAASSAGRPCYANAIDPDKRLRIGYVSADFRQHSVAYLIEPVIAAHDRTRIEVFCYSHNPIVDAITERIRASSNHFLAVDTLTDAQLADQVGRDQIDILVDLSGHTGGNRLRAFVNRPAPVQVTWLGYSGTTGLDQIDHILVDPMTCPAGAEDEFSENVVRLDPSYLTYRPDDLAPPPSLLGAVRPGEVVFASFNNAAKMSPRLIGVWASLLRELPGSRLLLKAAHFDEPRVIDRFRGLFEAEKVSADRLAFRGRTDRAELFELYRQVHIALDPFPYAGCLTSLEALWMGVPVVTLCGDRFVSRMGASLMTTLGVPELIADSAEAYVAIARDLAMDIPRLLELRQSLRARMQRSPLCDAMGFTRRLEQTYRSMWHAWCGSITRDDRLLSTADRT